jgi:hypothetical protein
MEQPGAVVLRMEKVADALSEYEEHHRKKEEGRRKLWHSAEQS